MKRSVLSVLLALLMVLSALPMSAFAAAASAESGDLAPTGTTDITEAMVAGGREPVAGEALNWSFCVHTFDEKMFDIEFLWYNYTDKKIIASTGTVANNTKTYALKVFFKPKSGYSFPNDVSKVNVGFYNDYSIHPTSVYAYKDRSDGSLTALFLFRMSGCTQRIVTFDPNGGNGHMVPVLVNTGSTYTLPECEFTHDLGGFECWGAGLVGDKITVTKDIKIKAIWRRSYSSSYVINDLLFSGGKQPAAGERPDFSYSVHKLDQDKYTLGGVEWWNLSDNKKMSTSDTFSSDKVYALRLSVTSKGNYHFIKGANYPSIPGYPKYIDFGEDIRWSDHTVYEINSEHNRVIYFFFKMESTASVVSFVPGEGYGEMRPVAVAYGGRVTYPECAFTAPHGKEFRCWNGSRAPGYSRQVYGDFSVSALWRDKDLIKVSELNVTVTDPRVGEIPDYEVWVASADEGKYTAKFYGKWYDATESRNMATGEAFKKNHAYTFQLYFYPKDGYFFAQPSALNVNLLYTSAQNLSTSIITSGDEYETARFVTFYYGVPATYLDRIDATLTVPRAGQKPSFTARTSTTGVSVSSVNWYSGGSVSNPGAFMMSSDTFEEGKTYIAEIIFRADQHYAIDSAAMAKFNSGAYRTAPLGVTTADPQVRTFRCAYTVPASANLLTKLSATITPPQGGDSAPSNAIAGSSAYKITDIGWYQDGSVTSPKAQLMPGAKLTDGKTYYAMFYFTPSADNIAFADHPTATINGVSATMYGSLMSDGSARFVVPITIGGSIGGGYLVGDTDGDGEVTILDATAIQRHLAELSTKAYNEAPADADGDGSVTIVDATAIQRYLADFPNIYGIGTNK